MDTNLPAEFDYRNAIINDIHVLVEEIGIRFAGTTGDELGASYVAKRLSEIGLLAVTVPFSIMGWKLTENARLLVSSDGKAGQEFICYPYVYSRSIAGAGSAHRVVYWGRQEPSGMAKFRPFERSKFRFRKYSLVEETDNVVGYIVSRDFPDGAKAAPWGALSLPYTMPTVMIGELEGRQLDALVSSSEEVTARLQFSTEFFPSATTRNVYARLPGSDARKADEEILVSAHCDTQYASPGAADDASGVACLLALSRYFQERRLKRSLLFAVYGGEEIGLLGSGLHFNSLKAHEKLSCVRACLNLDMLSCNEPNWIHASEDFLAQESVRRAARDVAIQEKYGQLEIVTPPWPSGDQDPFYDVGIPCVSFTWKGYKYPFTHMPEDTIDKIDKKVLFDSFQLACSVIEHIDHMLS